MKSGTDLRDAVVKVAVDLGFHADIEVKIGRRIWGAKRSIDVVLRHPDSHMSLGVECKWQGVSGSAEENIPATINDIEAWPIRGIVVFDGPGFSDNIRGYLLSTGKAIQLMDLKTWLELYFGVRKS